jgi:hypothetical protein
MSWSLFGGNSRGSMTTLAVVTGSTALRENGADKYFELPGPTDFFRFFMIKQTGSNTMGYNNLRLSEVEFFGRLATVG